MRWILGALLLFALVAFDSVMKMNAIAIALVVFAIMLWQMRNEISELRGQIEQLQKRAMNDRDPALDRAAVTPKTTTDVAHSTAPANVPSKPIIVTPTAIVTETPTVLTDDKLDALELPPLPSKPDPSLQWSEAALKPHHESPNEFNRTSTPQHNEPSLFAKAWDYAYSWLTGGNTVVRVGIVILFFGLAFLLKYSTDHALIPLPLRYFGVGVIALTLLVLGWRLRHSRAGFALALQGGAIASLYLLCFAALRLHQLLSPQFAMLVLVAIGFSAAMLAVLQNAMALALIGQAGGFLAPILASTGGGSHVQLFSYYALLNTVILSIAWYKKWRPLNLTGFVFTFGIGTLWGGLNYLPEHYASTQPFLILFFVMYVLIAILFARREPEQNWRPFTPSRIDGSLVFGVPLVGFGLQYALVKNTEFGAAFSALAMALFYVSISFWTKSRAALQLLTESFIALAIVFGSLAIPLALDAQWSSGSWAIEAAAIIWVSLRQQQLWPRLFSYLLLLGACVLALAAHLNHAFVGSPYPALIFTDLLMTAGLLAAWQFLHAHREQLRTFERGSASLALAAALLWWSWAAINTIDWYIAYQWQSAATALTVSFSIALLVALQKLLDYRALWTHPLARVWCWLSLAVAAIICLDHTPHYDSDQSINTAIIASALIVSLHIAFAAWRAVQQSTSTINTLLTHLGAWTAFALCWYCSWQAIAFHVGVYTLLAQLLLLSALTFICSVIAQRLRWQALTNIALALMPAVSLMLLNAITNGIAHPFADDAYVGWIAVFALQWWLLRRDQFNSTVLAAFYHYWNALLSLLVVTWSASYYLSDSAGENSAWPWLARLAIPSFALFLISAKRLRQYWPLTEWEYLYDGAVNLSISLALVLLFCYSSIASSGAASPLPYWPLINPLELAQLIALLAFVLAVNGTSANEKLQASQQLRSVYGGIGVLCFVFATCAVLRTVHHFANVPYQFDALWDSMTAQVSLSLFWTVLALSLMLMATRMTLRWLWLSAAALMALVVVKLFLVDLSHVSGLQRVLSFLGVGVLMLVIGYVSPVPPKSAAGDVA